MNPLCWLNVIMVILLSINHGQSAFITRKQWGARPPRDSPRWIPKYLLYAFIHHTYLPKQCYSFSSCAAAVRGIQNYHMSKGWNDIGYSFLIGQDGNVYEGRGWGVEGAHTYRYNRVGYGIAFIGDFTNSLPNPTSIQEAKNLINQGRYLGYLQSNYRVRGHRDVSITTCPGNRLYANIQTWPGYRKNSSPGNVSDSNLKFPSPPIN